MASVPVKEMYGAVTSRRSVRSFRKVNVPDTLIRRVLNYGVWAPSAHNSQPWRFILIKDTFIRSSLIQEMSVLFEKDMRKDKYAPEEIERKLSRSKSILLKAPVLILVCLDTRGMQKYCDEERNSNEYFMAVQSVAAAIQNILLGAHFEGLGACWLCAPLFCKDLVVEKLNLPVTYVPQSFIVMGYPDEIPAAPERKILEDVLTTI